MNDIFEMKYSITILFHEIINFTGLYSNFRIKYCTKTLRSKCFD